MKTGFRREVLSVIIMTGAFVSAAAQIPSGYYSSLKGKKGAELKTAVHELIKTASVLSYGSGSGHTWDGFYSTDRADDGAVRDRYSNDTRYFGERGASVDGMNIEHSFPKSWWGGKEVQAYKDLYNLMPCEQKINSAKSNYPMGKVTGTSTDNGCTKVGAGSNGYKLWEPADKWKGDFARGYMYMATAYQDYTWSGAQALQILEQDDYPTLQKWAYTLYLEWARTDKVDGIEATRNQAVSNIQGNRNPFVDFPNLMEYIWGDSIDYVFDPETTVRTTSLIDCGTTSEQTAYTCTFTQNDGGCVQTATVDPGFDVWTRDSKYGWKGTAFASGKNNRAESTLITPEIDLTDYSSASLTFSQAVNYGSSPADILQVYIESNGSEIPLEGITWPAGNSWTFVSSGTLPLDDYAGRKIRIGFKYTSTASEACTWEVKSMTVRGSRATTGIEHATVQTTGFDLTRPYKAYTIDGKALPSIDGYHGTVIIKQDGRAFKIRK